MKKRGFLQIPFAWLFAIIVGAVILFLAVYISMKLIGTEQTTQDAKAGKEIGVLLNPLETGFETGKTTTLNMPVETRIYSRCSNQGIFGEQTIRVSQKNFNKWSETDIDVSFPNKYLFSENFVEGKKFFIFSKPFNFPFKVADLIYITSKNYCFISAPEEVAEEVADLKQENLFLENCPEKSTNVCFLGGAECEINIDYNAGYVSKKTGKVYFNNDALMYAGIFSEDNLYECEVRRLMQRVAQLTLLYNNKAELVSKSGCNSNLGGELSQLNNFAGTFSGTINLNAMNSVVKKLEEKNDVAECRLW